MNHNEALNFLYYSLLVSTAVHFVLIVAQMRAYNATGIKSLIPMIITNLIGFVYVAMMSFRQRYGTPANIFDLALICAFLYTIEAVIGVWATVAFLNTVKKIAAKNAA
jgi:hypothetical protein